MLRRQFSTSSEVLRTFAHVTNRRVAKPYVPKIGEPLTKLPKAASSMPPYPYGPAQFFKQADRGLYGGRVHQTGYQVSEFGNHSKRVFHLNTQHVHLYSEILKRRIRVRLVASTLRTITREGGLDQYLLKDTPQRIKSLGLRGWELRWQLLQVLEHNERYGATGQTKDGKTLFGQLEQNGRVYGVSAGRQMLLKKLWSIQEPRVSLSRWLQKNGKLTHVELIQELEKKGVDTANYKQKIGKKQEVTLDL